MACKHAHAKLGKSHLVGIFVKLESQLVVAPIKAHSYNSRKCYDPNVLFILHHAKGIYHISNCIMIYCNKHLFCITQWHLTWAGPLKDGMNKGS